MPTLLIQGVAHRTPDEVRDLIVEAANVAGDAIQRVEVEDGWARVQVGRGVADLVARCLEGHRVGTGQLRAVVLAEETAEDLDELQAFVERFSAMVHLEREEEMRRHREEIERLTGPEREAKGRALIEMAGKRAGEVLGGYLCTFWKPTDGEPIPETDIGIGDLVLVSPGDPLGPKSCTGTVSERTRFTIGVVFDGRPPTWVTDGGARLDLYVNDITYQRMLAALETLPRLEGDQAELRDALLGLSPVKPPSPAPLRLDHRSLNDAQRRAVQNAVGAQRVHLVHGPPGTGKTTTLAATIQELVARDRSVLATAASNTAVDNLLAVLVERGVDAVRVGHPARVTPGQRQHTLDARLEDHRIYQRAQKARRRAFDLKDEQSRLTKPTGKWRRGLSDERIRTLARQGQPTRGIPLERLRTMADWLDLEEEIEEHFQRAERLQRRAIDDVLSKAEVLCTTHSTAGSSLMGNARYDVVVSDEATQATLPSTLIPLVQGCKAVLAGDHRQLPPTVISPEAAEEGLNVSLFERLAQREGDAILDLLTVQYRMNEAIQAFPSQRFYEDQLAPAPAVATHTLDQVLPGSPQGPAWLCQALDPAEPLVFVDTSALDSREVQRSGSSSRANPGEAQLVIAMARALVEAGLAPADVGVITPYWDQKDLIRRARPDPAIEVDTVDGFQGREKEVVLVSLVRSNHRGAVGFLRDLRRLNVALTRARRKLVVVGDGRTLANQPTYAALIEHVGRRGRVVRPEPDK